MLFLFYVRYPRIDYVLIVASNFTVVLQRKKDNSERTSHVCLCVRAVYFITFMGLFL